MKSTLILLSKLTIFIILICLFACQEEVERKPLDAVKKYYNSETCIVPLPNEMGGTVAYQIRESCAHGYIQNYQNYVDSVNNHLATSPEFPKSTEKLIYGAKVDLKELKNILLSADPNNKEENELYLMFGIMPKNTTDSTEIIFALKTISKMNPDTVWRYFDFTRPCPTSCPRY